MKKLLLGAILLFSILSFGQNELYRRTDEIVKSLYTKYSTYGLTTKEEFVVSNNKTYKVFPIGRLINIRIEEYGATNREYEILKQKLSLHYKNNIYVKSVYICGGGTIMIDCRY